MEATVRRSSAVLATAVFAFVGLLAACGGSSVVGPQATAGPTVAPTTSHRPTSTSPGTDGHGATSTIEPTTTLTPPAPGTNLAWIGGESCGATLLDPAGTWWPFRQSDGPLPEDDVHDIVVDTNGVAWISGGTIDGFLVRVHGGSWDPVHVDDPLDAIALAPGTGTLWGVSSAGVVAYDGTAWKVHPDDEVGVTDPLRDVAVDAAGRVWVVTKSEVARYGGGTWTAWTASTGLPGLTGDVELVTIAAGPDGRVWVAGETSSSGTMVDVFDGTAWSAVTAPEVHQPGQLTISADGRVWLTTHSDGLAMFSGGKWQLIDRTNSGLPSDRVRAVAVDGQGRLWVGTEWGLAVRVGSTWSTWTMATSGLAGNCIDALAVNDDGPPLPAPTSPKVGTVTGRLTEHDTALTGTTIVLCNESPAMWFSGAHPCDGQAVAIVATTGSDGRFTFSDVPVGEGYYLTWKNRAGQWHSYLIGGPHIAVTAGATTELGRLEVGE